MKLIRSMILGVICVTLIGSCTGRNISEDITNAASKVISNISDAPVETSARVQLSEEDASLVAWLIASEISQYPYRSQICLAHVILNRIEAYGFSDSARGVVFESGDFVSVAEGRVTGDPSDEQKNMKKYKIAQKALNEALAGEDITGGVLFFGYTRDGTSYVTGSYECGGMVFGK